MSKTKQTNFVETFVKRPQSKSRLSIVLVAILLLVASIAMATISSTSSVANANNLERSAIETTIVESKTTLLSSHTETFDPNAFDYQEQLESAGLGDINPLDYGMQEADKLLLRGVSNYEGSIAISLATDVVAWFKIQIRVDHYSWGGGFLDLYIKSSTEVNITNFNYELSNTNYKIGKLDLWLTVQGGSKNENISGEGVNAKEDSQFYYGTNLPNGPQNPSSNSSYHKRAAGFGWGHYGWWRIKSAIFLKNGYYHSDTTEYQKQLFGF